MTDNIKVICRFRPLNEREKNLNTGICFQIKDSKQVKISEDIEKQNLPRYYFQLDYIYEPTSTQEEIYKIAGKPVLESFFQGFNGTIFAYGQTSSGKTHTMQGPDIEDPEEMGVIPRIVNNIFQKIENCLQDIEFEIQLGILEIYMEKIQDLLDPTKINLKIRESPLKGIFVQGLTETYVGNK